MANNLTIAWGIPVDAVTLGASIEAYASAKREVTLLEIIAKKTPSNRQLPRELLNKITKYAQQMHFLDHEEEWDEAIPCFRGSCSLSEHLSEEEYMDYRRIYIEDEQIDLNSEEEGGDGFCAKFFDEWLKRCRVFYNSNAHLQNIEFIESKTCEASDERETDVRFKRARKLFAKDFGLQIHFQTFNNNPFDDGDRDPQCKPPNNFEDRKLLAYLILPAEYGVMRATSAGSYASFHASMVLSPSTIKQPKKELFTKAMRAMHLRREVRGEWTEGRPTAERHLMSNNQLQNIKEVLADGGSLDGGDGYKAHVKQRKRLNAMEWPRLMVFVSGTLGTDGD